jgi:hypothetical protein
MLTAGTKPQTDHQPARRDPPLQAAGGPTPVEKARLEQIGLVGVFVGARTPGKLASIPPIGPGG